MAAILPLPIALQPVNPDIFPPPMGGCLSPRFLTASLTLVPRGTRQDRVNFLTPLAERCFFPGRTSFPTVICPQTKICHLFYPKALSSAAGEGLRITVANPAHRSFPILPLSAPDHSSSFTIVEKGSHPLVRSFPFQLFSRSFFPVTFSLSSPTALIAVRALLYFHPLSAMDGLPVANPSSENLQKICPFPPSTLPPCLAF